MEDTTRPCPALLRPKTRAKVYRVELARFQQTACNPLSSALTVASVRVRNVDNIVVDCRETRVSGYLVPTI